MHAVGLQAGISFLTCASAHIRYKNNGHLLLAAARRLYELYGVHKNPQGDTLFLDALEGGGVASSYKQCKSVCRGYPKM